jgi:hypothetical protein
MFGITRQYLSGALSGFGLAVVVGNSLPGLASSIHHWQFRLGGLFLIVIGSAMARSSQQSGRDSGTLESATST